MCVELGWLVLCGLVEGLFYVAACFHLMMFGTDAFDQLGIQVYMRSWRLFVVFWHC